MPLPIPRVLLASAGLAALTACGGGDVLPAAPPRVIPPLLADDGSVMPGDPAAEPSDPAARARVARHAGRDQAELLVAALGDGVVRIEVAASVPHAQALARALAEAARRPGAPVLVDGDDPVATAQVADALAVSGVGPLWLVTR